MKVRLGRQGRRKAFGTAMRRLAIPCTLAVATVVLGVTGCMERLFYYPQRAPTEPPAHLVRPEAVWFRSADGTQLHGWFFRAAGPRPDRAPTILHVHGNAGNIESHVFFTEHLPPQGFNLFIFDFRGYGRSAGAARRRGPLIADAHAALDHLLARSDVDTGRIGVYGQSLGGAIALNLVADRPEIRAAVIESAFTSWREMAAAAVGGDPPGPLSRALARLLIRDGQRPIDAIRRCRVPTLIIHGTADRTIPPSHGRRLAEAGPTARLVEIPGGDHNTLRETHPEVDRVTIEFFRTHLSADDEKDAGPPPRPEHG